jgi:hypothetical protein
MSAGAEETPSAAVKAARFQYQSLIERVDSLLGPLPAEDAAYAQRVLAVARQLQQRSRTQAAHLISGPDDFELRKELGRCVEYLGRRSAKAIPCATLGRAVIADLSGDHNAFLQACRECDEKLQAFGLT